jgi:hypothetical protein
MLRNNGRSAAIAILTLALGIEANTAILGIFNGVPLRTPAFADPLVARYQ